MFSIVLVEDHKLIQQALRRTIDLSEDLKVVACAETAAGGLREVEACAPDLGLFDLGLPDRSGLWLINRVRKIRPDMPILILSMHTEEQVVASTLRAGANGFVHKSADEQTLLTAIHTILRGEIYLDPMMADGIINLDLEPGDISEHYLERVHDTVLNRKELEVMNLISLGYNNQDAGAKLGVSVSTIKARLRSVFRKLNVETRTEAVASAVSLGILSSDDG